MEIKGTAVKSIKDYVYNTFPNQYNEWFSSLSGNSQETLNNVLTSGWYSLKDAAIEPTQKIGKLFFNGDIKKGAFECGKYSADVALHGVYKLYVKFSSPKHIIDRASRILPAYYNPSKMNVIEKESNAVKLSVSDCQGIDETIEYRIAGWMQKALEISGCKNVEVSVDESFTDNKTETIFTSKWS